MGRPMRGGARGSPKLQQRNNYKQQQHQQRHTIQRYLKKQALNRSDQIWEAGEARRDLVRRLQQERTDRERRRMFQQIYGHLHFNFIDEDFIEDVIISGIRPYAPWLCGLLLVFFLGSPMLFGFMQMGQQMLWVILYAAEHYLLPCTLTALLLVVAKKSYQYIAFARQRKRLSATQTQCAVCLDQFEDSDEVCRTLVCGHKFHVLCVNPWVTQRGCCPLCRLVV